MSVVSNLSTTNSAFARFPMACHQLLTAKPEIVLTEPFVISMPSLRKPKFSRHTSTQLSRQTRATKQHKHFFPKLKLPVHASHHCSPALPISCAITMLMLCLQLAAKRAITSAHSCDSPNVQNTKWTNQKKASTPNFQRLVHRHGAACKVTSPRS